MPHILTKDHLFFDMGRTMTDEQWDFVNAIYSDKHDIVFCNAPAGTGKTTLAVATAKLLSVSRYKGGLLYIFNPVEESKMGFRPGTQQEKEQEYTVPLDNALTKIKEQPGKVKLNRSIENQKNGNVWVEAATHVFARGTNQECKVVIIDEAQNWTIPQLRKMLTRCHDNCKVVMIGHVGQCDLPNPKDSGFEYYMNHFRGQERAAFCELTTNFRGWIARHADDLKE